MHSKAVLALLCGSILLVSTPTAANAAEDVNASNFVAAVSSVAPEVFQNIPNQLGSAGQASSQLQMPVAAPAAPSATIGSMHVALPTGTGGRTTTLPNGNKMHRTTEGVSIAPIAKTDGSVQVTFVIDGPASPTSFEFPVETVPGATLAVQEDGSATYTGKGGKLLLAAPAPWATDSAGVSLPTRFLVRGSTLIQVVDHTAQKVTYPVVADPWFGIDLFSSVWYTTYSGQLRVNARKSAWGQAMHTPSAAGVAIFLGAGWNEVVAKGWHVTEKVSMHQQYDCHAAGGFYNLAGDWGFEKFRPTRTVHWSYGVAIHHCNWTTATRY